MGRSGGAPRCFKLMLEDDRGALLGRAQHEPRVCADSLEFAVDGLRGGVVTKRSDRRCLPAQRPKNPQNVARRATKRGLRRQAVRAHDDIQSEQPRAYDAVWEGLHFRVR